MAQNESVIIRSCFNAEYVDMVDVSLAAVCRHVDMLDDFSIVWSSCQFGNSEFVSIVCSCCIDRHMFNPYYLIRYKIYNFILYIVYMSVW